MLRSCRTCFFAICLTLAACSPSESENEKQDAEISAPAEDGDSLTDGTLGPLHYSYDQSELTRAEISLPLPPDFEKTVFAVKFIPKGLVNNLGDADCSYEIENNDEDCTAENEIGLALALLERPIETYGEAIVAGIDETMSVEAASIAGHDGFALNAMRGETAMRYTFVPTGERTLLLVERTQSLIDEGADALQLVRDSLQFPDEQSSENPA